MPKEDTSVYYAPGSKFTPKYLEELEQKHGVIFNGKGGHAFRVVSRLDENPPYIPLIEMFGKGEGFLILTDVAFDISFAEDLIENLQAAVKYAKQFMPEDKEENHE